jgi:hypothetical protein
MKPCHVCGAGLRSWRAAFSARGACCLIADSLLRAPTNTPRKASHAGACPGHRGSPRSSRVAAYTCMQRDTYASLREHAAGRILGRCVLPVVCRAYVVVAGPLAFAGTGSTARDVQVAVPRLRTRARRIAHLLTDGVDGAKLSVVESESALYDRRKECGGGGGGGGGGCGGGDVCEHGSAEATPSEEASSVCARCETVRYDLRECQRADWKAHKMEWSWEHSYTR